MIPVINYCWFGGNPLPEIAQKCILSWRKFFPHYEIKEWNESNYDVHKIPFTDEAYSEKKFAFVSDYARLDIAYNYGGLYFDIDVEVIKSFDDINIKEGFMAMESPGIVASGLAFELKPGDWLLRAHLDYYESQHFINRDGSYNIILCPSVTTKILLKYGLRSENVIQNINGITIYPTEYFCPKSFETGIINITENTHAIHHFLASWQSDEEHKSIEQRWDLYAKYSNDELIMNFYGQYEKFMKEYNNNNCNTISLKKLFKILIKRILNKIKTKCHFFR